MFFLWRENKEERAACKRELTTAAETLEKKQKEWTEKRDELEVKRLHDLKEVMQQRIADQETVHNKMLDVVKQCTTVMESTAASLDGHKDAAIEQRDSQREAAEELRKLQTLLNSLYDELRRRVPGAR